MGSMEFEQPGSFLIERERGNSIRPAQDSVDRRPDPVIIRMDCESDKRSLPFVPVKGPQFQNRPGVLPTREQAKAGGIDIVKTNAPHTDLSDRGPDSVKEDIQATLDHFLGDSAASELTPANTDHPIVSNPGAETAERPTQPENSVLKKGARPHGPGNSHS